MIPPVVIELEPYDINVAVRRIRSITIENPIFWNGGVEI